MSQARHMSVLLCLRRCTDPRSQLVSSGLVRLSSLAVLAAIPSQYHDEDQTEEHQKLQ